MAANGCPPPFVRVGAVAEHWFLHASTQRLSCTWLAWRAVRASAQCVVRSLPRGCAQGARAPTQGREASQRAAKVTWHPHILLGGSRLPPATCPNFRASTERFDSLLQGLQRKVSQLQGLQRCCPRGAFAQWGTAEREHPNFRASTEKMPHRGLAAQLQGLDNEKGRFRRQRLAHCPPHNRRARPRCHGAQLQLVVPEKGAIGA